MSDYKVYGFCDAGCRRRVPTYEEFACCASVVSLPLENGSCPLEFGKTYRINNPSDIFQWGFSIEFRVIWDTSLSGNWSSVGYYREYNQVITLPERIKYKDDEGLLICLKEVVLKKVSGAQVDFELYYLANNEVCKTVLTITDTTAEYYTSPVEFVYAVGVSNATSVVQVNTDATLSAEGVKVWTTQNKDSLRVVLGNLPEEIMLTGNIDDNDGIFSGTIHRARLVYFPQYENNARKYEGECTIMLRDYGTNDNARMAIGYLTIQVNDDLSVDQTAIFTGDYKNENGSLETCCIGMLVDALQIVSYKGTPVHG